MMYTFRTHKTLIWNLQTQLPISPLQNPSSKSHMQTKESGAKVCKILGEWEYASYNHKVQALAVYELQFLKLLVIKILSKAAVQQELYLVEEALDFPQEFW